MKTIAIFSGYALPHLGGIERYVDNLSKELIKDNYKVIIVSSNYTNEFETIERDKNIINIRIPIYKIFRRRYPIPKKNKELKKCIAELNKYKIDAAIVNTRFHLTTLFGAKYSKKRKIPVFLIEHGSQHLTVNNKVLDFFGLIYEHLLTMVVKRYVNYNYGVSEAACKWQKHFHINSNGVWYNSINDFSKGIKLNKNENGKINISYAGRVLKQKGIERLINSFKRLEKKYDNIYLTIAGDGEYYDEIKDKFKNEKKIKLLGKLNFEELKELYAKTDIFIYAPVWPEGLPTSMLEAGLLKCATIGSPQGGIKEVIDDNKNGLMIETEKELEEAMEKLIVDEKLRNKFANNLYKTVKEKFLWSVTSKKIISDVKKGIKNDKSINL